MKDFKLTEDCDFFLNKNNSLEIINNDYNQILIDTIVRRLESSSLDWDSEVIISASLDYFRGERLTQDIVEYIKSEILRVLISDGLLSLGEVDIVELPMSGLTLDFFLRVYRKDKYGNDLLISFNYDTRENKIAQRFLNPKESLGWLE
jgi:hypothetical protein